MKEKLLWCGGIIVLVAWASLGDWHYIEVRNHQTDPNGKLAKQIHDCKAKKNRLAWIIKQTDSKSILAI